MRMSLRDGLKLSLSLLTKRDQKLLFLAFLVQISLSVLDLIGIGAIAAVVAIAVSVIQESSLPTSVTTVLDFFSIPYADPYQTVVFLAVAAVFLFSSKTILTALITRRQFKFLANRDAAASTELMRTLVNHSILTIQAKSSQETISGLTTGVSAATTQFLGNLLMVSTESSLLIVVTIALFIANPLVASGAFVLFGSIGLILNKILGDYAQRMGQQQSRLTVSQAIAIQTTINGFRELSVMNRQHFFSDKFTKYRWEVAQLSANTLFLGQISRYVFELALVLGGFVLAASQFFANDALAAITTLSLFLAAGTRLMPSMLRLQTGIVSMKAALGTAQLMVNLKQRLDSLDAIKTQLQEKLLGKVRTLDKKPVSVAIRDLTFTYPGATSPAIKDLNLSIAAGSSLGLIGKSGSGKSTLVDLILGILLTDSGKIEIDDLNPREIRVQQPGIIGYVPQDITLIPGSIEKNVALGLYPDQYEIDWIWEALEAAQLSEFVKSLPNQLETEVGERGVRLSGGQRQRIGLARAMLSQPSLLILDEATSSLDVETESEITEALTKLPHDVTKIVIAHRLATIQKLDQICILEDGKINQVGSFEELRKLDNILANQAELLENNSTSPSM
jgi:ABC-type multidrug transport system fused ATPase/permease subunit